MRVTEDELSGREAAVLLGVSETMIENHRKAGRLPGMKRRPKGTREVWRYRRQDVEALRQQPRSEEV